jgi:ribonuclease VapC
MVVVDTSAIMAILQSEADEARLRARLEQAGRGIMSAANVLELQLVISGRQSRLGWKQAEIVMEEYEIAIRPFDERQLEVAREAAVKYGKGHHKAGLNFGDCFAYALARVEDLPLLCTGKDFAATDIAIALD